MKTSIPIASPTCLSAVQKYVELLREKDGTSVELCPIEASDGEDDGDRVVCVNWNADATTQREAWDDEEESTDTKPTMSAHSAAQYQRNLLLLGRQEAFAAAWLSGLQELREGVSQLPVAFNRVP